jgi:hypothetical protein
LHKWSSHSGLFDHNHPGLSRALEGDMLDHEKHPFEPSTVTVPPEVLHPTNTSGTVPPGPAQAVAGNS